jgi:type II secretory pathway pseudopilin PulG
MKRGADSSALMAGFTIVETMIVLAVTGLLFVAVANTWFGRQHKTEFQTSAQEIRSQIQQVISDVQNGYFPNQNNFSCHDGTALSTLAPGEQGTNKPCVFLGKVIQFNVGNKSPEEFRVYTIAADGDQTDLAASKPTAIAPSSIVGDPSFPDNSVPGVLNSGLSWRAYKIGAVVGRVTTPSDIAIGFLSTLGELEGPKAYTSGTQQVNLYPIPEAAVPANSFVAASAINDFFRPLPNNYKPNTPTELCFQSGGTNQFAIITIGGNSSTLTADLSVRQGTCDANFS